MYWRSADINKVPKYEREQVRKMKKHFALKRAAQPDDGLTPEERMKAWADRRFEEAKAKQPSGTNY